MSQTQPEETLSFKIGISGTYWGKRPQYSIMIDEQEFAAGFINNESGQVEYITFTASISENHEHRLQIKLLNKDIYDTIENADKTAILKDLLLNIHSVEIDEISLEHLMWSASKFIADDASRPTLDQCVNLGWNGAYTLTFSSPFYLWLLENM